MTGAATRSLKPATRSPKPAIRSPKPARPVEIELKYRPVSVAAGERYLALDEIAGLAATRTRTRTVHLEDRYLDTADGALAAAGFAARLRATATSTVISVKSTARRSTEHGPYRREELEGPADRTSAPRGWPASAARSLILELCGDAPLVELVTLRQLRRKRELRAPDWVLEVSLDEVEVVARSKVVEGFVELEVELVRGSEDGLATVARVLDADPELHASHVSKLEAALSAVRDRDPALEAGPADQAPDTAPDVGPRSLPCSSESRRACWRRTRWPRQAARS
ncbi:MAG: CYTH domain-containing protein [Chloroflexota bacterium]|nr:CYTH domain-containing protein [Chloroflexota bacterium]